MILAMRGRFLLDYIDLLLQDRAHEGRGFRHGAPTRGGGMAVAQPARGRERWVINKIRALNAWYSKGLEGGSQLRVAVIDVRVASPSAPMSQLISTEPPMSSTS